MTINTAVCGGAKAAPFHGFVRTCEQGVRIESIRISVPAEAARGDAGDAKIYLVPGAEFFAFTVQETDERAADVAESDNGKVVIVRHVVEFQSSALRSQNHLFVMPSTFVLGNFQSCA